MRFARLPALIGFFVVLMLGIPLTDAAVLGTDDLIGLKASGVSEEIVRLIVESGYSDLQRVIRLKQAGFQDDTIASIIKRDLKEGIAAPVPKRGSETPAADETIDFKASANVRIEWYLLYRGKAHLQNSDQFDAATVSLLSGKTLKLEWPEKGGLGILDVLARKPFKSPFYWNISTDDIVLQGKQRYSYVLQSGKAHRGKPDIDESHYWIIYLQFSDPQDRLGEVLRSLADGSRTEAQKR